MAEVAKAMTGLLRWIWREISGGVLAGFDGETVTPREKKRTGRWRELGEMTKAVWMWERLRWECSAADRVLTRRVNSG